MLSAAPVMAGLAAGTPPTPVTCTARVPAAAMVLPAQGSPLPVRVSQIRVAVSALKSDGVPAGVAPDSTQPSTSRPMLVVPAALYTVIWPAALTGTRTRLPTIVPEGTVTLVSVGRVVPAVYAVKLVAAVDDSAVRLAATAETPVDGMPSVPVTWMVRAELDAKG